MAVSVATPAKITITPATWLGTNRSPNSTRPMPAPIAPVSVASTAATAMPCRAPMA